jgi:hypothetical protein
MGLAPSRARPPSLGKGRAPRPSILPLFTRRAPRPSILPLFTNVVEGKTFEMFAKTTAILGRGYAICVIVGTYGAEGGRCPIK